MTQHITQSKVWAQFRLTTPGVKKVLRLVWGKNTVQIFIHRVPFLPFTVAYLPRPQEIDLEEIIKVCKKEKALCLKVEPATPLPQLSSYPESKPILPRHTIYVDLTKPDDELLKAMHEKTRYNIRLAQKKGVIIRQNEDVEGFIKLLASTENRQGFYSHYPNYYRKLWEILHPEKICYLLSAYLPASPGTPIASIMLFAYQSILYYPYGGSDPKFRQYMAPHLLHWEAMKLGKKLGCKTYDLWGSYKNSKDESDPWFGIYRFKSGFGGQEIDFPPTVDIPLSPLYSLFPLFDSLRWIFLKLLRH